MGCFKPAADPAPDVRGVRHAPLPPEAIVTVTANVAKSEDEAARQDKLGMAVIKAVGEESPYLDKLLEEGPGRSRYRRAAGSRSLSQTHTIMRTAVRKGGRFALEQRRKETGTSSSACAACQYSTHSGSISDFTSRGGLGVRSLRR